MYDADAFIGAWGDALRMAVVQNSAMPSQLRRATPRRMYENIESYSHTKRQSHVLIIPAPVRESIMWFLCSMYFVYSFYIVFEYMLRLGFLYFLSILMIIVIPRV